MFPATNSYRLDDHELMLTTDRIAPQLSPRENLILGCLVEGDSNKSIAKKIDMAEETVKVHVKAIRRKLRVHNRAQAAIWGMKNASHLPTGVDTAPPPPDNSHADARIAIVVDSYRAAELVSPVRAGASGYFVRGNTRDVFLMIGEATFLADVLGHEEHRSDDHEPILAADQIAPVATDQTASQLSPREKLILGCLVEGDSNKSIAKKIDIAEATVKVHLQAILQKIHVHNRAQAAIWGMKNAS